MSLPLISISKIPMNGFTGLKKILQSSLRLRLSTHIEKTEILQQTNLTLNRCLCSCRITTNGNNKLLIDKTLKSLYHNNSKILPDKAEPESSDSDGSKTKITNVETEKVEYSIYVDTTPGSIKDDYRPFENETQVIQDVVEQEWNPIPQPFTKPKYPKDQMNLERMSQLYLYCKLYSLN